MEESKRIHHEVILFHFIGHTKNRFPITSVFLLSFCRLSITHQDNNFLQRFFVFYQLIRFFKTRFYIGSATTVNSGNRIF